MGRRGRWLVYLLLLLLASACARRRTVRPVPTQEAKREIETLAPVPGEAVPTGYTIQVGAFRKLDNAVRLTASLRQLDLNAYYYAHDSGLYKVRFGDFPTRADALRQAELAIRVGFIQEFHIVSPQSYTYNRLSRSWPADLRREVVHRAESYLGIPYRWGGDSPENGFDCSGLTLAVYKLTGLTLPRTSAGQYKAGRAVTRERLQPGDLVFFHDGRAGRVNHVGIYIGGGRFIHAPGKGKVIRRESLATQYFRLRYAGARRYLVDG